MKSRMIFTGDINLLNVPDPAVPFAPVSDQLKDATVVFGNLECCLFEPPGGHTVEDEAFLCNPDIGGVALKAARMDVVGLANNVNYGADAIQGSIECLKRNGIAYTGAGANMDAARAPAIIERNGLRFGFLQRSTIYWPTGHEAGAGVTGVAVVRAHTAYQVPMHSKANDKMRPDIPPLNRAGLPPIIVTWADPVYMRWLAEDIAALRAQVDVVVVAFHWGLGKNVLEYMSQIGHGAIDAGADMVISHGQHQSLPVEIYRGKPIFYGLGNFCFHTGHGGRKYGDWVGMMAKVDLDGKKISDVRFQFVRHNDRNQTISKSSADETAELEDLIKRSAVLNTKMVRDGDDVRVEL